MFLVLMIAVVIFLHPHIQDGGTDTFLIPLYIIAAVMYAASAVHCIKRIRYRDALIGSIIGSAVCSFALIGLIGLCLSLLIYLCRDGFVRKV